MMGGAHQRRCADRWRWQLTLLLALLAPMAPMAGCAATGTEFRPYLRPSPHPPVLARAVAAERSDVPSLARAGAIIIGNITASGNEFSGQDAIEEAAALEAARRGGTHLVLEASSTASSSYEPGEPITLSFLVIRLADAEGIAQLPEQLQPRRGINYTTSLALDPSESEPAPPPTLEPLRPLAKAQASGTAVPVVDGSRLKPIPRPTVLYDDQ